jgi:hypothetical protein
MAESKAQVKTTTLQVVKLEKDAVIVLVNGWRMRVFFDKDLPKEDIAKLNVGRTILVEYVGNLEDVHTLEFKPLKSVE